MSRMPKSLLVVRGNMTRRGADRVGVILAVAVLVAVILIGTAGILFAS